MINSIKLICASLLLSQLTEAKLSIKGPKVLKEKFKDNNGQIQTVLANFGHIPYGQSMDGRLYYNASNPYGCSEYNKITNDVKDENDDKTVPIFLVK
jgi:hypothetical protein